MPLDGRHVGLVPIAGAALGGLLALRAFEPLERWLLGARPVYAPPRIAARLLRKVPSVRLEPAALGHALRLSYGSALAALYVLARARLPRSGGAAALCAGALVTGFERVALPLAGATPPLRRWRRGSRALLFLHALAFTWGAERGRRAAP